MPKKKPMIDATVLDILHVTVDAASTQPATVALEIEGQANVQLRLSVDVLTKLEAMLAKASVEQARHQLTH